jgi:hypothetical protein
VQLIFRLVIENVRQGAYPRTSYPGQLSMPEP